MNYIIPYSPTNEKKTQRIKYIKKPKIIKGNRKIKMVREINNNNKKTKNK